MKTRSVAWDRVLPPATLFLLGLVVALPLWGPGLLNTRSGGDSPFLVMRTHQLVSALRGGHFPVRWMPDAAYGLGFPMFSYYAALPYYLAAALHLVRLDILSAIKLTQTLFAIAAALAAYGWARRLFDSRAAGWLTGAAYSVAPYHLVNLYVRGDALSEFAAFAFYPLVLWGLDRLLQEPVPRRALFPALAYAGLILTHNISALTFTPFALLYYGVAIVRQARGSHLRLALAGLGAWALGLGLAAWYWIPALAETGMVQLTAQTTGYLFYGNHFRGNDLIQRAVVFAYGDGTAGSPFSMGLVQAVVAGLGILLILAMWTRARRPSWAGMATLTGLGLSTFMITPASKVVWEQLPLLQMTQFPWRFLSIQALFVALATGSIILSLPRGRWVGAVGLALLLSVTGLAGLRPDYLPVTAADITAQRLQLYELFTGNVGTSIRYEYLPEAVIPRPWTGPPVFDPESSARLYVQNGLVTHSREITHQPTRREWEVEAGSDGATIVLPLYFWPGWKSTVDGEPTQVGPDSDSGMIRLSIPAGQHTITVWLGRTPLRTAAEAISLSALVAALLLGYGGMPTVTRGKRLNLDAFAPLLLAGLALVILVAVSPQATLTTEDDLTMDFDQMPLLHHNPEGVSFGSVRLIDYQYSSDHVRSGDVLTLDLEWEGATEGLTTTVQLMSPAGHLLHVPGNWAQAQTQVAPTTRVSLPISHRTSPGPALVSLQVHGQQGELRAVSPADRTLGTTFLRPVWIESSEPAPADFIARFASDSIQIHAIEANQLDPSHVEVLVEWSAARSDSANWGLSLRLTDTAGNEWSRVETQPGYGFLPTSLWPESYIVPDRIVLSLPPGTPPGSVYTLSVGLYRVATWEGVGTTAAEVELPLATFRPDAPTLAQMEGGLALSELEVPQSARQGEALRWTAYWQATGQPRPVTAEWRLEGPSVLTTTLPLAPGSEPTSWPIGAWIAGRAQLNIPPTTPPGTYTLRVTLKDIAGRSLGSYSHERPLSIEELERIWDLPPLEQEVRATFGNVIELAGYDLAREDTQLQLTLHWRALSVPDQHYMLFVHVADPATALPLTQTDTMPREFTYPTGLWAPEEIITDDVSVSLADIPPGTYDLVVGWYDPDTRIRLEVRNAAGNVLPDGRLILQDRVIVP